MSCTYNRDLGFKARRAPRSTLPINGDTRLLLARTMPAMSAEEGGLLGDLPRRRPGTRSAKRADRAVRARSAPRAAPPEPQPRTAGEVATEPLRLAVGAAEAGLKVASRITGELIRRMPRL